MPTRAPPCGSPETRCRIEIPVSTAADAAELFSKKLVDEDAALRSRTRLGGTSETDPRSHQWPFGGTLHRRRLEFRAYVWQTGAAGCPWMYCAATYVLYHVQSTVYRCTSNTRRDLATELLKQADMRDTLCPSCSAMCLHTHTQREGMRPERWSAHSAGSPMFPQRCMTDIVAGGKEGTRGREACSDDSRPKTGTVSQKTTMLYGVHMYST